MLPLNLVLGVHYKEEWQLAVFQLLTYPALNLHLFTAPFPFGNCSHLAQAKLSIDLELV